MKLNKIINCLTQTTKRSFTLNYKVKVYREKKIGSSENIPKDKEEKFKTNFNTFVLDLLGKSKSEEIQIELDTESLETSSNKTNLKQIKSHLPITFEYTSDDTELLDDEKTKGRVIILSNSPQSEEGTNFLDEEEERSVNKLKLSKI